MPSKKQNGLGAGGAKRHRKVLRDNIQGITKGAIKRMLRRSGVIRQSNLVYEEIRGILKIWLADICKDMVAFTMYGRRKTIKISDLEAAFKNHNISLAAGLSKTGATKSLASCPTHRKSAKAEDSESKAHRRSRPGTAALREIRFQQKNSDCLVFRKANFSRLTREIVQDFAEGISFSKGVIPLLQLGAENYLVKLCECAYRISLACGRKSLYANDLQLVRYVTYTMHGSA